MDFEKVNLELIEVLLEWIVDGKHSYPPGNCFLSSFMCEMAQGLRLWALWRQTSLLGDPIPPLTFKPSCEQSCLLGFWGGILLFEVHLLFVWHSFAPIGQKDVNNMNPKRNKAEEKAWIIHILDTQSLAKWAPSHV